MAMTDTNGNGREFEVPAAVQLYKLKAVAVNGRIRAIINFGAMPQYTSVGESILSRAFVPIF